MRIKLLIPLIILLLVACAPATSRSTATTTTVTAITASGIKGSVTIGPTCPVMRVEDPCPDKPYQATLTILTQDQKQITQFQTDANGYFKVDLAPGNYILHPESPKVMPRAQDISFTVTSGQFTEVDVTYDSGIR
jgi:hypothetical protein